MAPNRRVKQLLLPRGRSIQRFRPFRSTALRLSILLALSPNSSTFCHSLTECFLYYLAQKLAHPVRILFCLWKVWPFSKPLSSSQRSTLILSAQQANLMDAGSCTLLPDRGRTLEGVKLGRSVRFVCNANVVDESFVWCRWWLTPVEGSLFQV